MRACLGILGVVILCGCGSEVELQPPGPPTKPPPENPPSEKPLPKGPACGASEATVTVTGAQCAVGSGGNINVTSIEPAPSIDGITIAADDCVIGVRGVGVDLASEVQVAGLSVYARIEANWLELYPLTACQPCTTCSCPQPLPILFAADGLLDAPEDLSRPVQLVRGATTCTEEFEGGCDVEGFELTMNSYRIETNVELGTPPILLGTVSAAEGEAAFDEGSGMHLRNLRSHGLSPDCLAQVEGEAAWVAYRATAPSL